jgi:uncharacterized BrkB/YihY/UPF0761 family membrane protein
MHTVDDVSASLGPHENRGTGSVKIIYLKSVIAGLLALVLAAVVIVVIGTTILAFLLFVYGAVGIGIDMPRWHLGSPLSWLPAIIIFSAGFYWNYRRLSNAISSD